MPKRQTQLDMLPKSQNAYGGDLRKKAKNRGARAISTRHTMHMVLRSTLARGAWSFKKHDHKIRGIVQKFARKYGVRIISLANAGNHLHMQLQLTNRQTYRAFVRAITGAISMAVTGASRWSRLLQRMKESGVKLEKAVAAQKKSIQFWDYRPFTRIIHGFKAFLTLKDYIHINRLEGWGYTRDQARFLIEWDRFAPKNTS